MGLRVAWYWARADARVRWRGLLAVALLVGLAGGITLGAVSGARRTASSYDRFRAEARSGDAFVTSDVLPPEVLEAALDQPGVASYSQVPIFVALPGGPADFGVFASPDGGFGRTIDRPRVLDGRLPDPAEADEIAINEATAEQLDLAVGDTLRAATFSAEQWETLGDGFSGEAAGPRVALHVVGLVRAPEDLSGVPTIGGYGTPAFADRYLGRIGAVPSLFAVDLEGDAAGVPPFQEELRRRLPGDREWGVESAADGAESVHDAIDVLRTGILLFAASAGIAGAVASWQAVSRHLSVVRADQPALAAIGASRGQRAFGAFLPVGLAALGGAAVAVVVAVAVSPFFPIGLARRAEPKPGIDLDVTVLTLGYVGVAVVAGAWAWAAAWSATRTEPARSSSGRPSRLSSWLARTGAGPRFVIGARMALEPGRGRSSVPVRSALMGAIAGIAGLVAAVTFGSSLDRLVETPSRWGWSFDLAPNTEEVEDGAQQFVAEPGVTDVGILDIAFVRVEGQGVQAHALTPVKGSVTPAIDEGRAPAGPGEVAVGRSLLDRLDKEVGDTVALEATSGRARAVPYEVVGTATFPTLDDFGSDFAEGLLLTPDGFGPVRQEQGYRRVVLELADGAEGEEARARLLERRREQFSIYALPRPPGEVANLAQVDALPWILGAFLLALAVLALGHALVVAVRRRGRDLAVLRSIGFRRADVRATVAWQSSVVVAVGVLAGLPLGVAAGRLAWSAVASGIGVSGAHAVPVLALILLSIVGLVVAQLVGAWPARAATKSDPATLLRSE